METPWSLQGFYGKIGYGDKMKSLYDFNYEEMSELALEHGWKKFRGHQIFQWLYRKRVTSIDDMSDLSKDNGENTRYKRCCRSH